MIINPEFKRNLWLEMTFHRLIAIPAVLGVVFFLVYVMADRRLDESAGIVAQLLIVAILFLWGSRQATDAVFDEIRDKTWDTQRMSAMGPWSMAWGKLLGSTAVAWYGGIICLGVMVASDLDVDLYIKLKLVIFYVALGLMIQAVSFQMSLAATHRGQIFSSAILLIFIVLAALIAVPLFDDFLQYGKVITWAGMEFDGLDFIVVSVVLFMGWAVISVYRLMAMALRVRTAPWIWWAFLVFLTVYFTGLMWNTSDEIMVLGATLGFWIVYLATYASAFLEKKDPLSYKRMWIYWRSGNGQRLVEEIPVFLAGLPLLVLFGAICMVVGERSSLPSFDADLNFIVLPMGLFLLRDLGILMFFSFAKSGQRAELTTMVYLVLLYGILPGICAAMDLDWLKYAFIPPMDESPLPSALVPGSHCMLVFFFTWKRWSARFSN